MRIGFTGTRNGMTERQTSALADYIHILHPKEFHHGDCVGADAEAGHIVRTKTGCCEIIIHPPIDGAHRAYSPIWDVLRQPKTHFARNRDIVDETDLLIGTPAQMQHQQRGGTWYTLDYAVKRGKRCIIIFPDGRVTDSPAAAK